MDQISFHQSSADPCVFIQYMDQIGFHQSSADPCVFIQSITIIAVYMDDLIIITNDN